MAEDDTRLAAAPLLLLLTISPVGSPPGRPGSRSSTTCSRATPSGSVSSGASTGSSPAPSRSTTTSRRRCSAQRLEPGDGARFRGDQGADRQPHRRWPDPAARGAGLVGPAGRVPGQRCRAGLQLGGPRLLPGRLARPAGRPAGVDPGALDHRGPDDPGRHRAGAPPARDPLRHQARQRDRARPASHPDRLRVLPRPVRSSGRGWSRRPRRTPAPSSSSPAVPSGPSRPRPTCSPGR